MQHQHTVNNHIVLATYFGFTKPSSDHYLQLRGTGVLISP